jgi:hypothetical protein
MQTITTAARLAFDTSPVKRKYKVFVDWVTKGTITGTVTAGEFNSTYFSKDNVKNDESYVIYKPFILSDSMRLGDDVRLVSNKYENGWLGANRSSSLGVFGSAEVISEIFTTTILTTNLTVFGSQYNYPVNMDLYYRNSINTAWVLCQSYTNLTSYITVYTFPTLTTIKGWKLEITKINLVDMFACIAEVTTGFREDVSGDLIKDPMDIAKELEYSGASVSLGNISANTLRLRLNNTTQKYNPENVDSYLYPFLRYNKVIQPFIGIDLGDSIEWFAQGKYYIREIKPNPDMTVEIYAVDKMFFLNGEDFSSSIVYVNYTKSELQQMLIEDFGLGATEYSIDSTIDDIPYAYFDSIKYAEAIKRLEISDGGVAFFDELGVFNSKTRGWTETPISAYYDDSTIIKGSASSPVIASSMKNYIRIKSNPLDSAIQEVVYNSSQSIVIPAGSSKDVPCYFNKKPCIDIIDATFTQTTNGSPLLSIVDSYSESNYDGGLPLFVGNYLGAGQSFTGDGNIINSCKFYLSKYGSPTGNAVAKIYAHSGTFGVNGIPTGAALATSDNFDVSTLATSLQLIAFTFSGANKITLTNGTKYVVSIEYGGGDMDNLIYLGIDNSSPTHSGNIIIIFSAGSYSSQSTKDSCFYVYSDNVPVASITIISESKYSHATFLTFSNSGIVDENVLTIEIQAKPLAATGANEVVSQDVDLIAVYGKSEYLIDSEFIQDMTTAQTLADDLLIDYKDPEALEIEIEAITRPYLQLGDTVMIRNSKLSIGG